MAIAANEILEKINETYDGVFGKFEMDEENDECFATALHPIKNRHTEGNRITLSVEDDIESAYADSVAFVDEKTRPSIMGKPVDVTLDFGFEKQHARLNNYSMMGAKGGYVFIAACKGNILFCAELHVQKRPMEDADMTEFMKIVNEALSQ
ncbi:MAG: hypothetical protein MJZ21_03840 [archaeon]|nr:hypothetical protein [archaeon]